MQPIELAVATNGTHIDRSAIADSLLRALRDRTLVPAPSRSLAGFSRDDAHAIAEILRARRIADGETAVGYKVGFTNAAVRAQFGAAGPMQATMYAGSLTDVRTVEASALLLPRIEPEIVVGVDASGEIAWAALGFEIVQSHVANWDFGELDAIADFGLHAALIIGERRPVAASERALLLDIAAELRCDDVVVERGAASDVDGGAIGSLDFLRTDLARVGRTLGDGDIITTGSVTRVPAIMAGQRWTLSVTGYTLAPLTIEVV